jgi:hypothetical protein
VRHHGKDKELPGGLSFAIRELTGEELAKCQNPNSIEALDFLRLQYKPPPVLESVITTESLRKYDRLFKHLLRLSRMLSVVRILIRDSTSRFSTSNMTRTLAQKFRVEALHFVQSLNDYASQVGVNYAWERFDKTLLKIEDCIDRGDIDGTIGHAQSLHGLKEYHEDVLDQILFALLLSKKHARAARLLEGIFSTILAFATLSKENGVDEECQKTRASNDKSIRQLHAVFTKQVRGFVGFLRGLDGVGTCRSRGKYPDLGRGSDVDIDSVFMHLLLRLDMNQYY